MTSVAMKGSLIILVLVACAGVSGENLLDSVLLPKFDAVFTDLAGFRGDRDERLRLLDSKLDQIFLAANRDPVVVYRTFSLFVHSRELTEDEGYLMMQVNQRLIEHYSISLEAIVSTAVPMLDSEALNEQKAGLFCLNVATSDGRDFGAVLEHLTERKEHGDESTIALIDFMFQSAPARALIAMRTLDSLHSGRDSALVEMAEYLESNVRFGATSKLRPGGDVDALTAYLSTMAGSDEWWVRLCAAEVVRKVPELQSATVIDKLRGDEHPSVRASIRGLEAWKDDSKRPPQYRIAIPRSARGE